MTAKMTANQIVTRIIENARAETNEELEGEFKFSAAENGWSDEEIQDALNAPLFPWLPLGFKAALCNLVNGDGDKDENIAAILAAVEPLCETDTTGNDGAETTLEEWLYMGDYNLNRTPEDLAAEWDALSDPDSL